MRNVMIAVVLCAQLLLVGCAGVGIIATTDPDKKMQDAIHLYRVQGRPIPAERLIFEAMEIYQERSDLKGLGWANLTYGDLLLASVSTPMNTVYTPRDGSITSSNRVAKSKEYATRAFDYFQAAAERLTGTEKFDELTGLYFQMALASNMQGDRKKACGFYDKAFVAYGENMRLNPTAKPYGSVPETLTAEKKQLSCE